MQIGDVVLVHDASVLEAEPLDEAVGYMRLVGSAVESAQGRLLGKVCRRPRCGMGFDIAESLLGWCPSHDLFEHKQARELARLVLTGIIFCLGSGHDAKAWTTSLGFGIAFKLDSDCESFPSCLCFAKHLLPETFTPTELLFIG